MAKKKKAVAKDYTGEIFPVGSFVAILRPHHFSSYEANVVSVDSKTGLHRLRVVSQNGKPVVQEFDAEASGSHLEVMV